MDKKRFHLQKSTGNVIAYNDKSSIINWPFLKHHITPKTVNHLGNMVYFTPGEIFPSFIDFIISKIKKHTLQNTLIDKIKLYRNAPNVITVDDLRLLYKYCRRKKRYNNQTLIKLKSKDEDDLIEDLIIHIITTNNINEINSDILNWFKFPKSKTNINMMIQETSQTIKRGEIDAIITQTSVLNKDYNNVNDMNKTNLDVHRIGRFNRNVPTNDFWNLCVISCGVQKLLPRDSKTKEPKTITKSEIGFIDLINTPDNPRNCGLILETTLDVIPSTLSLMCPDIELFFRENFPHSFEKVNDIDDDDDDNIYVSINLILFRFRRTIPTLLCEKDYIYICRHFGVENYFRMLQYVLKIHYPCVELLKESDKFWVCNNYTKILYKIHKDGLLYTSREMEYFEENPDTIKNLLPFFDNDFLSLWIGKDRKLISNIFGPSIRGTPRPNTCHLPRVSHAVSSSWKHAVGVTTNTQQGVGSIHQKNITVSYYSHKLSSKDLFIIPGIIVSVLVVGGFNNQEDGIVVRKSAIERGVFLSTCYETANIRISYSIFPSCKIKFIPTITKGYTLKKGLQIGYFRNKTLEEEEAEEEEKEEGGEKENHQNTYKDKLIDNFSSELKLVNNDDNNDYLAVIWDMDDDGNKYTCFKVECIDVKEMKHLKMYITYSYEFAPTVGDKLQTSTSQKGVITQILSDEDTPYIINAQNECFTPDIIINPQYLKRQTLDNIFTTMEKPTDKNPYMENCFSYTINDTIYHMVLALKQHTGRLMNPITGYPYFQPLIINDNSQYKCYAKSFEEYVDEDGFTCINKGKNDNDDKYILVEGSIYLGLYFNVFNHRPKQMMQSSRSEDILRTDFSGTPVRGKKGGFSTGPQEQLAFNGMGMTRFNQEISLFRSDFNTINLYHSDNGITTTKETIGGSTTFKRMNDDLEMRNLNVTYKIKKLYE